MLHRLSLRARLLVGVIALAALGLAVADVATYTSLRSFLLDRVDSALQAGHPQVEETAFGDENRPGPRGPGGPPAEGIDWYEVTTLTGARVRGGFLVGGGSPPQLPAHITLPAHATSADGERATYFTAASRNGGSRYRIRASIERQHPGNILVIATSLSGVDGTLHRLVLIELLVTLGVLAAIGGLGLWVVRLGMRPLREIEATARAITGGDLSHRVEHTDERTEVGRVGGALNTMLDRIEASDRRLRRFVADASHELRTPLAAVRAYAELFSRGADRRPEDLARAMSGISRESERMSLLVEDLLLLARLDEGRPLARELVQLDAVVSEAVETARTVEPERPIELSAEPLAVLGDHDRLRQAVDNLLANARAHTPAGAPVSVTVSRRNGNALIEVADSGAGLAPDEAERIFERFYRADESRARARGGVGLGLAIVAAVAQAHGGRVAARSEPGRGATFSVELPLLTSTS